MWQCMHELKPEVALRRRVRVQVCCRLVTYTSQYKRHVQGIIMWEGAKRQAVGVEAAGGPLGLGQRARPGTARLVHDCICWFGLTSQGVHTAWTWPVRVLGLCWGLRVAAGPCTQPPLAPTRDHSRGQFGSHLPTRD